MTEIAKHTPGPWVAKREDPSDRGWCVYDNEWMLVARRLSEGNAKLIAAAPDLSDWNKPETAPKDGTLLQLLIEGGDRPTANETVWVTIGFNNLDNDGEDCWQFAGWCWEHDHFTDATKNGDVGKVIGWQLAARAPATER